MNSYKINHLLSRLMEKNGITDGKLAQYTSVGRQVILQARLGKSTPKVQTLVKISDYFGISLNQLLGLPDPKQKVNLSHYAE